MNGSINFQQTMRRRLYDLHPDTNGRYAWSDLGAGNLFADYFKDHARYVPDRSRWFVFDGVAWQPDTGNLLVMQLCKELADALTMYALSIEDEKSRRAYLDYTARWQKRSYRETVLKDAASVYPLQLASFDHDPMTFNCVNGTLDLSTGKFHSHRAVDFLTKVAGVAYDPDARCERWERFIDEVTQGNAEKARFLQKALGYALTGDTRHECFFVLYGATSRNGKSVTMETFARLMGDYGKAARPDTIAQKQTANGSGPSEDVARLAGARFVNVAEPDKRLVLSSSLIKALTGNDMINARFLGENSFEFRPAFKLFVNTNHLPTVTDETLFASGRVQTITFDRHFLPHEQDKDLKSELTRPEHLSGILNWCVDGLAALQAEGFTPPDCVLAATEAYRAKSNRIEMFLSDEAERDPQGEAQVSAVFSRYVDWCASNGFKPENLVNFRASLERMPGVRLDKRRPRGGGRTASKVALAEGFTLIPRAAYSYCG